MSDTDTIERRKPKSGDWTIDVVGPDWTRWIHPSGILVLAAVNHIDGDGPTHHVSVSFRGGRAPREVMRQVRADFDMQAAEEDNHSPAKIIRSLWLPVNRDVGRCPCVDEPRVETPFGEQSADAGDVHVWREAKGTP